MLFPPLPELIPRSPLLFGNEKVRPEEGTDDGLRGYKFTRKGIVGRKLLCQRRNGGMELVKRLKDLEGKYPDEVAFWARQLAYLVREGGWEFDFVTCPPSSGKREYSLAWELATRVSEEVKVQFQDVFINPNPRGSRASIHSKLAEIVEYETLSGAPTQGSMLLVDDAYCTGSTLVRCAYALPEVEFRMVVLCGS